MSRHLKELERHHSRQHSREHRTPVSYESAASNRSIQLTNKRTAGDGDAKLTEMFHAFVS